MMGVPQQDRGKFRHWSDELALVAFGAGGRAGQAGTPARWPGSVSCRSTWPG